MARTGSTARKTGRAPLPQGGRIVQLRGASPDGPAFSVELVTPESAAGLLARKRPAAHPEVIATSSETGTGIAELRAAVLEAVSV